MFKSPEMTPSFKPEAPETKKEKLSDKKVLDVIFIIDIEPQHLDKVTPENIREITEKGEKLLREERAEANDFSAGQPPSEVLKIMNNRSSASHAIQCAVNGAEDFKAFRGRIEDFAKERGIAANEENFSYLRNFLGRHIKMKEVLTGLYEIDIARRFGEAKKDKRFFRQEELNFGNLKEPISDSLKDFKDANKEALEDNSKAQEKIRDLEKKLAEADYKALENDFYEFCQDFSDLIFIDYEQFNADKLKIAVEGLER